MNRRREELWETSVQRLRLLLPRALDVVEAAIGDGDRQAAMGLLKLAGVGSLDLSRIGPTDAAVIAEAEAKERAWREREQAFNEVRAAEDEAELATRRFFAEIAPRA